ncbi:MAG TPA: energy transducer TonB [Polyangia bacterium]|nr:energy transducer TonB [Polyangia bacterium]
MTVTVDARRGGPRMRLVHATSCTPAPARSNRARARRDRRRARRRPVAPLGAHTVSAALEAAGARPDPRWPGLAVWALVFAAHALLAAAVWRTRDAAPPPRNSTHITVHVHEQPVRPPPVAAPPAAPARPSPARATRPQAARPARIPQPSAPPPVPVKVVGLSLESTSEAGQGPAFAVGDTLAGTTARSAAAPRSPAPAADPPAGPNRVARGVPRPGSVLTPPRRLHEVKPHYPDARRAAGAEADVLLVVSLDAAGHVLSVTVGRSSGDDAFDESARTAARQERFSPALRDGVAVPTTFTFTTHFRLDTP